MTESVHVFPKKPSKHLLAGRIIGTLSTAVPMATPATAGAATLVRQYLMDVANRPAPQGALVKALLILGAQDMGARNIPNNDEGWVG